MWTRELLGTDVYHLLAEFMLYSMLGWLVESVYMSFCNRKVTNRGFAKGPFCPIYGFGAGIGYLVLSRFEGHNLVIYFLGAGMATLFEYVVGQGMIKLLGDLWWDYNDKPFNYKGIICLESTIAWGFYALAVVYFVHDAAYHVIDRVDMRFGIHLLEMVFWIAVVDYVTQLLKVFHVDIHEKSEQLRDFWISRIIR